ncbi:MAG TPA: MBOAT family O-acyltransferase [Polyangiaceae bacterium]|nr:MBOAT family O-acyltransferase [Polyangiaceae bacterium]
MPADVQFTTLAYAKFFALAFVVTWLCRSVRTLRLGFLLAASYVFYAQSGVAFLALIFACSTADFLLSHAIGRAQRQDRRRAWLALTVVMNLGVLAYFKYAKFGVDTALATLSAFGVHVPAPVLAIALPVGISFFTFESMSYVIDVYRGELEPHPSYLEYLTFVAFFPHLVAGPIVRPRDLLPQLARQPVWRDREASSALLLIATGLFKKLAIADYLALNLVDRVFDAPTQYSALECYVAMVGYAVQIYADFSGYTDIAIGSAALLGVRFPANFAAPYQAHDIVDFWRRWHISLSTWLRDYLYIPLGGNRRGPLRTYLNLIVTMLLGGLWHGPSWTFVVWGGLHGVALACNRAWRERFGDVLGQKPMLRVVSTFATFQFVLLAWVFFRAHTFRDARAIFTELLTFTSYHPNLDPRVLLVLATGLAMHFLPLRLEERLRVRFGALPGIVQGIALFAVLLLVRRMASAEAVPFVYFQF